MTMGPREEPLSHEERGKEAHRINIGANKAAFLIRPLLYSLCLMRAKVRMGKQSKTKRKNASKKRLKTKNLIFE